MSDSTQSLLVLGAAMVLFMSGRVPVGLVALGAALSLYGLGVIDLAAALSGFSDPVVVMIAALFVVAESLDASGLTARLGQRLVQLGGGSTTRLVLVVMVTVALLTALINVNGAVAALLPVVVLVAARTEHPGRVLLALPFAAHAGSMLTLTGTPVNLIVSEAAQDAGVGAFGYFEFALAGVPLLLGTIAIIALLGPRLAPRRTPAASIPDLGAHADVLADQYGHEARALPADLVSRDIGVVEVVVPPRSRYVGERVFPGMVTSDGQLAVEAIARSGAPLEPRPVQLEAGDTMLLRGSWDALEARQESPADLLVVHGSDAIRRQVAPLGVRAWITAAVVLVMIVLMATGAVPAVVATLLAAMAVTLVGVVSPAQAWGSIAWTTILLIAGMIPVSGALTSSGAAADLGDAIVDLVQGGGVHALLLALFAICLVLGQVISNTATALIMIPIGIAAAQDLDVPVPVVLMSITIACASSYLTPIATPANMMVQAPGNFRFGDYWRLGLPLATWFGVVAVLVVPLIW